MSFPTRRTFLQTTVAAIASLILPKFLLAVNSNRSFWFLHADTGDSWSVADPVAWSLENARQPILERASKGLLQLTPADDERIIRLVVRRCRLNLLDLRPGQVVVHHWGQQGRADLRPFFKQHDLGRPQIKVVVKDRKKEVVSTQNGDDLLYGERLGEKYPLGLYLNKFQRRFEQQPDDWMAAQCSYSNYCWEGIEQGCIPWKVLKAAWRNESAPLCVNCDKPTLLLSFGIFTCGFYRRGPTVTRICSLCRSRFVDHSPWDATKWMLTNLGEPLLPSADMMFGNAVKYTLPWTRAGQAHELNLRLVNCLNQIDGQRRFFVDTTGHVVLMGERRTVNLPPFDGRVECLEEWCRRVFHLISDED